MIDFPEQRRRIEEMWARWVWLLEGWDIAPRYFEGTFGLVTGKSSGGGIIAEARANWRYLNGSVRWDLMAAGDVDDAELEETVVHEMVHFLVNEMNSDDDDENDRSDHEERVVTVISRHLLQQRRRVLAAAFFQP
jgi:hypothetical protein